MKKKSIISILLVLVMLVNLLPLSVITTQAASKIYPTTVHGTWDGTYNVSDFGSLDARKIRVCITKCTPSGEIEGNATLENGDYGKYVLKGNVDLQTGEISFQGTEWIHNPGELSMLRFSGSLDANSLQISGLVENTYSFSLKRISSSAESVKVDKDNLKLDYDGEYDGSAGFWGAVRRNIEIHIEEIDDEGNISGRAIISPSPKADSTLGANGSYYFSGKINFETSSIHMQGHTWIDYPIQYDNFTFVYLEGYVDAKNGLIIGTTDNGIWAMQAIDYEEIEDKKSGFTLGEDNGSFVHTSSEKYENAGFIGSTDYTISEEYFERLTKYSTESEKNEIKKDMKASWGGSCYGIAATMGLLYENYISLDDLTDSKTATNYYTLPFPGDDKKLLDTINYYQLSQGLANGGKACAVSCTYNHNVLTRFGEWYLGGDGLSSFLKTLVNYTSNGHLGILGYNLLFGGGHAILVTGCEYDAENKQYIVELYDMNCVDSPEDKGEFVYMYINNNYSTFKFTDAGGNLVNGRYMTMYYMDWESMGNVIPNRPHTTTHAKISIALGENFKLVNNYGEYLQVKDGEFTGDMTIYDIDFTANGDSNEIVIETDNFSTLDIVELGESVDIEVSNKDSFMALEAQGVDEAYMDLDEALRVNGDDYTFKAFVSTDAITDDEDGLVSFSGKATDDVVVTRSGQTAEISSNEKLTDLKSVNYSSIYTHTVECPDLTSAEATAQEIVFTKLLGDCDNDGDLSILDATEIQRYLAVLTSKYDINYDVCDVDNDGDISVLDSTRIQMTLAGLI